MSKRRIAILGGGCGAMAAAFALSSQPRWQQRYELTVYQMGWRLGGKGASGRNAAAHQRIEEHGIHVWGGYYENAFRQLRQCYEELDRPAGAPLASWRDAFEKKSFFSLMESHQGRWLPWNLELPENDRTPGDGGPLSPKQLWSMFLQVVRQSGDLLGPGDRATRRRRLRWLIEFGLVHLRGIQADGLLTRGTAAVDGEDWAAWLARHGASQGLLSSPLVRGIYDLMFAYRGGDTSAPSISAGRVLYTYPRFALLYKGAIFWEMQAGMGDVVFAPYYQVLQRRGVGFRFFHRVERLGLSRDRRAIQTIELLRQAQTLRGEYAPLVDVKGLPCWPSAPLYEQLVEGSRLSERAIDWEDPKAQPPGAEALSLQRGRDFDDVVLGISLGALPGICQDLMDADLRWQQMLTQIPTVATLAMQLWMQPDRAGLGWEAPATILCANAQPFNTWADMSHLLDAEQWPAGRVGHIAYFCGPLSDPPPDETCDETTGGVLAKAGAWLRAHSRWIWPQASKGQGFDPGVLVDAGGACPPQERLQAQFWRANQHPSDRYVQSTPESLEYRMDPGDSGFSNLFLAGDWARTSYNLGTIEAATLAGIRAAEAIACEPQGEGRGHRR